MWTMLNNFDVVGFGPMTRLSFSGSTLVVLGPHHCHRSSKRVKRSLTLQIHLPDCTESKEGAFGIATDGHA